MNATSTIAALKNAGDPKDAAFLQGYFKTGPGEYGEGDLFLGIRVPALRTMAKEFRELSTKDVTALLKHKYHEVRALALMVLVLQHKRGDDEAKRKILDLYLRHTRFINNWDLVDASAGEIVGTHVEPGDFHLLTMLAESPLIWERRIAIIATSYWIAKREFRPTLAIAAMLLDDEHDLMHKAVGWMLREVGKRDEKVMLMFLKKHYKRLPRTALRYAIERCPPAARKRYMRGEFA